MCSSDLGEERFFLRVMAVVVRHESTPDKCTVKRGLICQSFFYYTFFTGPDVSRPGNGLRFKFPQSR